MTFNPYDPFSQYRYLTPEAPTRATPAPASELTPAESGLGAVLMLSFMGGVLLYWLSPVFGLAYALFKTLSPGKKAQHWFNNLQTRQAFVVVVERSKEAGILLKALGENSALTAGDLAAGDRIEVTFPRLVQSAKLYYEEKRFGIDELMLPDSSSPEIDTLLELAPIINERFILEKRLWSMQIEAKPTQEIQTLMEAMPQYAPQAQQYHKLMQQQQQAIVMAEQLLKEQDEYVRESLIAARLAKLNQAVTEQLPRDEEKLRRLQEQCQETQNFINAYIELKSTIPGTGS